MGARWRDTQSLAPQPRGGGWPCPIDVTVLRAVVRDGPDATVTESYKEALEVALCCGWIDGQKRPESEQAWLQRFLSRSSKSIWSKINREKALALIANGKMKAAGLEAIENAKKKTLDRANRYAVLWRIQTVRKAETRARKIEQLS